VHVQTAGQTAGQISWSDLPRRLILPVKRYLDVTGRSRGARRTGHRTGAPHSHRTRVTGILCSTIVRVRQWAGWVAPAGGL
jgi:hypothetical protein